MEKTDWEMEKTAMSISSGRRGGLLNGAGMAAAESCRTRGRRRNFSLIELLIVVAIIAILAGILLPALSRGRDKAGNARCASNLKNLIVAGFSYADDHNGYWMPNTNQDYLDWQYNRDFRSRLGQGAEGGFIRTSILCPLSDARLNVSGSVTSWEDTADGYRSYVNRWVQDDWSACPAYKLPRIKTPARKAYWGDGVGGAFGNYDPSSAYFVNGMEAWVPAYGNGAFAWRHAQSANLVYFDGHAAALRRTAWDAGDALFRCAIMRDAYLR